MPQPVCKRVVIVGTALAIAVTMGFASPSQAAPCKEDSQNAARVDITLDWDASAVVVDPEMVEIYLSEGPEKINRVCWVVVGLQEGQTLQIEAKPDQDDYFPSLERDIQYPRDFANSGKPSKAGTWAYNVVVVNEGGDELLRKDPGVDIKP